MYDTEIYYPGTCFRIAHMAYPCTLHLATVDAVVAMRSESRAGPRPRAMATVIFSFCFFGMPVFVCRSTVYILLLLSGFWQAGRPDTKEYSQPVTPHEMTHAVHTRQDDARSMWL